MNSKTAIATILLIAGTAAFACAQFTPIVTDFSSGVQPFVGTAALDTDNYASGPSSMRIAHQYTAKSTATEGTYAGTVVQTGFWTGPGFPAAPVDFYCMLKDLTPGTTGHQMDIHMNFGTTQNGYTWLGIHYFNQGAFSSDWQIGMDETIEDIGSLRNPWNGQPTWREKYDELYGTLERKPAVVLTLIIETMYGAICIDNLSITMVQTAAGQAQPLTVARSTRTDARRWCVVSPSGRLVGQSSRRTAAGYVVRFAQGQAQGSVLAR